MPTAPGTQAQRDLRAIGPNMRIETQRSAPADAAMRLEDSQRNRQVAELKDLLRK